ncbi:Aldo/keto reductase, partial [Perkinsus sp. BL_2016]
MSGSRMPLTGFGTWKLREPELEPAIRAALKVGYRHFDGAAIYENESELGRVFQTIISNEQFVSRSELFITSKLWVTSMKPRSVRPACEQSLKDWKMDYFDLYLIHWPFCFKSDTKTGSTLYDVHGVAIIDEECQIEDTWREMEKLVQAGLVKNIGVSNFSLNLLKRILAMSDLKIIPAVNQVELHPYLQQRELRDYCNGINIVVEAYSSLGSGKTAPYLLADESFIEIAKDLK